MELFGWGKEIQPPPSVALPACAAQGQYAALKYFAVQPTNAPDAPDDARQDRESAIREPNAIAEVL